MPEAPQVAERLQEREGVEVVHRDDRDRRPRRYGFGHPLAEGVVLVGREGDRARAAALGRGHLHLPNQATLDTKAKKRIEVLDVQPGKGGNDGKRKAGRDQTVDAIKRRPVAAWAAYPLVHRRRDRVEADGDELDRPRAQRLQARFVDQRGVGDEADIVATRQARVENVEELRVHEDLAAGQRQIADAGAPPLVKHAAEVSESQLVAKVAVLRVCVAVHAA